MQIDFLGMQAFLSIVEHGGFIPAAEHLHLSQTAISHRIRKLEDSLGVQLFRRTTRQVTLTDAGRALLPGVRKAMRELESSYEALRLQRQFAPDWLAFGCLPTLSVAHLAAPLQRFKQEYPHIAIRVLDDTVREIVEHVESGVAAFGISIASRVRPGLPVEVFAEEPFVLACHRDHPLVTREVVSWEELVGVELIRIGLPAGNAATIDDALGERRTQFNWRYEVQRTALALDLVRSGVGVTVVPALSVSTVTDVTAIPLIAPLVRRSLVVLRPREAVLTPAAQLLCDCVVDGLRTRLAAMAPVTVDAERSASLPS